MIHREFTYRRYGVEGGDMRARKMINKKPKKEIGY